MADELDKPNAAEEEQAVQPEVLDPEESGGPVVPISKEKAQRFYDRMRDRIAGYLESKGRGLGKTGEYLLLVPDVFMLMFRLMADHRVSTKNRVLLGTGIAYFVLPIDLIPEALVGPVGYLDDLVFAAYILDTVINDTDEAVLREHWSGTEDVFAMIRRVLTAADTIVSRDVLKKIKGWMK